jgi:hypothetical protein
MPLPHAPAWAVELLEVVTTGLPFCVFKALTGLHLLRLGATFPGWALLALAAVDVAINLTNLGALVVTRRRAAPACTFAVATSRWGRGLGAPPADLEDLGNAADVLLSFVLVAAIVGLGQIPALPALHLQIWNNAVVLNVLGAGLSRLHGSWQRIPSAPEAPGGC